MVNLQALERLTVKERLQVVGLTGGFFAVCALLMVVWIRFVRADSPQGGPVVSVLLVLGFALTMLCLVALVQGFLGKRTALTGGVLFLLAAQGEVLAPSIGAVPRGFPHLSTIRESIHVLYRHFSSQTIRGFARSLPRELATLDPKEDPVLAVQRLARRVVEHLGLPVGLIIVTFEPNLKVPGQVELSAQNDYFISLRDHYRRERQGDIAAILAHEITHIYLFRSGLWLPSTFENEILTDVASIYLGVGWLLLNAYRRTQGKPVFDRLIRRTVITTSEESLGYLTPDEFGYVLAKRSLAVDESPHRFFTSLAAREAFQIGARRALLEHKTPPLQGSGRLARRRYRSRLREAMKAADQRPNPEAGRHDPGYRFEVSEITRVVFDCPVCGQKLRLPVGRGRISAHCSACDATLDCET